MDIYFYLYKTSKPTIGTLKYGVREGSEIISRKSVGFKIPYSVWSETQQRVKPNDKVDYILINNKLDDIEKGFINTPISFSQDEDKDFFEYALDRIAQQENVDTRKKYKTILKDFQAFLLKQTKKKTFPIGEFRNPIWIDNYKLYLKTKAKGYNGKRKKNYVIRNYVMVLHSFISFWNKYHGIRSPIPTQYFLNGTQNSGHVGHRALSRDELLVLENHEPESVSQAIAKNLFLFQLYGGGMRVSDAFLMRFSSFRNQGVYYTMKKNKHQNYINFDFLIARTLRYFYPEEFEQAKKKAVLGKIGLSALEIKKLFSKLKVDNPTNLLVDDIDGVINALEKNYNRKQEELLSVLKSIKIKMEDLLAVQYHHILSQYGERFVFPYLLDEDFKNITSTEPHKINEHQSYLLQKARAKHNSNLKRIRKELNIGELSGHVPRHTLSSMMLNEGSSVEEISLVLGHSNFSTTQEYLKKFPEKLHKSALEKFRGAFRPQATDLKE
jgi:site-specific recombinase XerD